MPKCEICEKTDFELIATEIREGDGKIARCENCGLVIQDLGWSAQQLKDYYEKEYQQTNSLVAGAELAAKKHFEERLLTIGPILERVEPLLGKDKTVLEIGAGAGSLLFRCKPLAKKCVAIEMNTPIVDFIKNQLGMDAYAEDVNTIDLKEQFDLIITINTLDHLPNPLETVLTMKRLLKKGGRIYMEIPNREEAMNFFLPEPNLSSFRKFFWHRAHLFYFTRETITNLFHKAGLEVDVTCRHEYTLKNFMNWYFTGKPQKDFVGATTGNRLFSGESAFEREMDAAFLRMEQEFKGISARTFRGDSLCCVARHKE